MGSLDFRGLASGSPGRPLAPGAVLAETAAMPATVLIIADQLDIATLIARPLVGTGVRALIANDVRHAGLILQRESCDAVVLDLAAPGHCESVMQWLKRDPSRAGMAIVRVSALARNGGVLRQEIRADACVPKPFTPRQIADAVRTVLVRRTVRQRVVAPVVAPAAVAAAARPSPSVPPTAAS